jgi:soluble epoxide hydrolase/lipid-phosphate phosphatase
MREFIEAGSTDVLLRPYARDASLKEGWKAEKPSVADWEPTFCWYKAFTSGIQSEADKAIPEEQYKLQIPVLAIMCDGDGVNPPETLNTPKEAGLLPDLEEHVLHSGHWCTYERPEELSKIIKKFVRGKGFVL